MLSSWASYFINNNNSTDSSTEASTWPEDASSEKQINHSLTPKVLVPGGDLGTLREYWKKDMNHEIVILAWLMGFACQKEESKDKIKVS